LGLAPGDLVSEAFALSAKEAAADASASRGAMTRKARAPGGGFMPSKNPAGAAFERASNAAKGRSP